jgi:hypothetical protein
MNMSSKVAMFRSAKFSEADYSAVQDALNFNDEDRKDVNK